MMTHRLGALQAQARGPAGSQFARQPREKGGLSPGSGRLNSLAKEKELK